MKTRKQKTKHLIEEIDWLAEQINSILSRKEKERYFEGIILTYTFTEKLLAWLIFIQIVWDKCKREKQPSSDEIKTIKEYCNNLSMDRLLKLALCVNLIDYRLFLKLDQIRQERNLLLHSYWLYKHRGNKLILRKKLEKLANTANILVNLFNHLVEETGLDESYGIFEIGTGKKFLL